MAKKRLAADVYEARPQIEAMKAKYGPDPNKFPPEEQERWNTLLANSAGFDTAEEAGADADRKFRNFQIEQLVDEEKRKGGRPKSESEIVRVSMYKDVASRATFVASVRGIPLSQYLSEIARATVNADFAEANKELGE